MPQPPRPAPRPRRPLLAAGLAAGLLALAACDSAEERAEGHYRRGLELMAAADVDRALIEFRNVFRLDGDHLEARLAYADALRGRGELREALGQYLRVIDQAPRNAAGQLRVAELALRLQDFETAEAAAAEAVALDPANPEARAVKATLDYRAGTDRPAAIETARGVLAEAPGNVAAHMILVADAMNARDPAAALALLDTALAAVPGDEGLHLARLAALETLGDFKAAGAQLARMAELFPANPGVRQALVRWHLRAEDPDGAEAVLRAAAEAAPAEPEPALTLVQFLYELRGPEAAGAELDALIAARPDPAPFQQARAGLDFAEGRSGEAIAALTALTAGAEPSDAVRDLQASLAEMLAGTGDAAGAAALVETVLAGDAEHVAALKLRARAGIDADRPEAAIADLRTALSQAPRDPAIMTLMAEAHMREGSRELAGERLALAVEMSAQGPADSARYARFLLEDGRTGPAEGVVTDALRRLPEDPALLVLLGEIHLARADWARAGQVAELLRGLDDPQAAEAAAGLELARLQGEGRGAEALALLEGLPGSAGALKARIEAHLIAGDPAAARAAVEAALAADPADPAARLLRAGLHALDGEAEAAEALYRGIVAETPDVAEAHEALFAFLAGQGRTAEAEAALDAGITALPAARELRFIRAGVQEAKGDFEAAIATYEALYAEDSGNALVANNLASLLTTQRSDPESLERAFAIARRLRTSDTPHFQDTYGWILHRRGDSEQAVGFLAAAAASLPDNPLVQFHLAEAELALGRQEAARAGFRRALDLAGTGPLAALPQMEEARARLTALEAAPEPEPEPAADPGADPAPASDG